jgi:hypothetical protein
MPAKNLTGHLFPSSSTKLFSRRLLAALLLSVLAFASWSADRLWPRQMRVAAHHRHLAPKVQGRSVAIPISSEIACAEIASFDDQLEAFLRYEYLRGRDPDEAATIFLIAGDSGKRANYKIFLQVENDQLTAVPRLDRMQMHGLIAHYELVAWTKQDLALAEQQSRLFENAYNVPNGQKLETLPSFQLVPALADFLVFKSQTDWRVVGQSSRAPQPLTHHEALRLASDILDVAHFYNLPLDYFLGVGAMENNYMDVNGDLAHAVWKKHADRGDIVLERQRKRVLVSDYSIGAWQIFPRDASRRAPALPERQAPIRPVAAPPASFARTRRQFRRQRSTHYLRRATAARFARSLRRQRRPSHRRVQWRRAQSQSGIRGRRKERRALCAARPRARASAPGEVSRGAFPERNGVVIGLVVSPKKKKTRLPSSAISPDRMGRFLNRVSLYVFVVASA